MMKYDKLLNLFAEYLEKQDTLSKLTESEELHSYSYSEVHTIDSIGKIENPNVTKIAANLNMTRGAISKITKRLLSSEIIESYSLPNNKKEIYFKLTDKGMYLFQEHEKRHLLWQKRDSDFFKKYSDEEIKIIMNFMTQFNEYLNVQIKSMTNK